MFSTFIFIILCYSFVLGVFHERVLGTYYITKMDICRRDLNTGTVVSLDMSTPSVLSFKPQRLQNHSLMMRTPLVLVLFLVLCREFVCRTCLSWSSVSRWLFSCVRFDFFRKDTFTRKWSMWPSVVLTVKGLGWVCGVYSVTEPSVTHLCRW